MADYRYIDTYLMLSAVQFYQSAEDVPDPRDLSSEKNNLMVFDDLLLEKQKYLNRILSEEDTATLIISI